MSQDYVSLPEFNVVQFFVNGTHEYVRRRVHADEAIAVLQHYCRSIAVQMGVVERVIVTDGGDCCCFEWTAKDGVTFPDEHKGRWKPEEPHGSHARPN
jgi:hypothetical protein